MSQTDMQSYCPLTTDKPRSALGWFCYDIKSPGYVQASEMERMESNRHSRDDLAAEIAILLGRRLAAKDILRLLHVVFMTVEEAADLLRVKPSTVSTWISNGTIPVRYAGGRPPFLLAELMEWTLPDNDRHSRHRDCRRWPVVKSLRKMLAATRERVVTDGGLQETADLVLPLSD